MEITENDQPETTPEALRAEALAWLDEANRLEEAVTRHEIFEPHYFRKVEIGGDWRQKSKHILFEPANTYESWLAHGAVPQCFRHFLTNLEYVGRAELALYLRLILLMDHLGVYVGPQEDLKEGLFKQTKQVGPVLKGLVEKHLVLASQGEVAIPWQRGQLRRVYQRPRAAYTIAKLHYIGFDEEVFAPGSRKVIDVKRKYLDKESYRRCVETLAHAYKRRTVPDEDRPPLSLDLVTEWLYRRFVTEEETARLKIRVDEHLLNRVAEAGTPSARKKGGRGRRPRDPWGSRR